MYATYRESIFEPSQGVRAIIGVEAEMALRGTFKRVRICPGKGVNMPRTSLTTNGHNCNIYSLSYLHISTLTHTRWHSLSHTLSHFFLQHMLFCLVTWQLVNNRDKCR